MGKRRDRHEAIRDIVRTHQVRTQTELAELMTSQGFTCTQATISRDVQELELMKGATGCYVLSEELRLQRLVVDFVISSAVAGHLVVIRTAGGSAGSLAAALDNAFIPGILGTVAGDDTLFVAAETPEAADKIDLMLKELLGL